MESMEHFDIATMSVAEEVDRHINKNYWSVQLEALQTEARRLGYWFSQTDKSIEIPPFLAERLSWAVAYWRGCHLNPDDQGNWENNTSTEMRSGFAAQLFKEIISALGAQGIHLQEGPQARVLLAEEERRLRDLQNPTKDTPV